jgi:hypothetical protein
MAFNPPDQLNWEYPWWMEIRTFVQDEGFNVQPQPQPHQPQLVEILTYNTTVHADELSYYRVDQEGLDLEFKGPVRRPPTASWSENVATYVTAQYDEAPAPSSTTALVRVNHSRSSTTHASAPIFNRGNKRRLEDHVGCFSIHDNSEGTSRKRRAFDPDARKKVAVIRKVGSCSRCKARRVKVSFGLDFALKLHLTISSATSRAHAWHAGKQRRASVSRNTFAYVKRCWTSALARRVLVDALPII